MATRTGERTGEHAGERPSSRSAAREIPERSPEYSHLSLEALRTYRKALAAEENRVSYWRRLMQARLDLLEQSPKADTGARIDRMRSVMTETRVGAGRQALTAIMPAEVDDVPPLPDLAGLWAREIHPEDTEAAAELAKDLGFAELQLSAYRTALHRRLAKATTELIARYREEPTLCLSVLPLPPGERIVN